MPFDSVHTLTGPTLDKGDDELKSLLTDTLLSAHFLLHSRDGIGKRYPPRTSTLTFGVLTILYVFAETV